MELQDIDDALGCAVVTGATSGIGRAIASELAARGVRRLMIVAREEDELTVAKVAVDALEAHDAARVVGVNNQLLRAAFGLLPDSVAARAVAISRGAPGQE